MESNWEQRVEVSSKKMRSIMSSGTNAIQIVLNFFTATQVKNGVWIMKVQYELLKIKYQVENKSTRVLS